MDQLVIEVPSRYTSVALQAVVEAALPPDVHVHVHVRRYDSRGRLVSDTCRGVTVLGPASALLRKSAPWWRRLVWALTGALCLALPLPALAMGERLPRCYDLEERAVLAEGVCRQREYPPGTLCLTQIEFWEDLAEGRCRDGVVETFRQTYGRKLRDAGLERRSGEWVPKTQAQ